MKLFDATAKTTLPPSLHRVNQLCWLVIALVVAIVLIWLPYLLRSNDFVLPVLNNLHNPLQTSGLYATEQNQQTILRWTEPTATIQLPSTLLPQQLDLQLASAAGSGQTAQVFYNNQPIGSFQLTAPPKNYQLKVPQSWQWQGGELELKISPALPADTNYKNGRGVELLALAENAAPAPPLSIWLAIFLLVLSLFGAGLRLVPALSGRLDSQFFSRRTLGFIFLINVPPLLLTLYWNFDRIQAAASLAEFVLAVSWLFLITLAALQLFPNFYKWPKLYQLLVQVGLPLALLLVAVGWLYNQIFIANYDFYWDDYHIARLWTTNQLLGVFAGTWDPLHFEPEYYRPLTVLSFALDYNLWGLNSFGYHLTNLLLESGVALCSYWLLRRLAVQRTVAWLVSGLVLLLPTNVDATVWISERSDSLALLFMLLGLLALSFFWQKYELAQLNLQKFSDKALAEDKPPSFFSKAYLAANLALILALGSKEIGIILPEIWLLWLWIYSNHQFRLKQLLIWVLPAVISVLYLILRSVVIQAPTQSSTLNSLWGGYVSAVVQSCWGLNSLLGSVTKTPDLLQNLFVIALLLVLFGFLGWRGRELLKTQPRNLALGWRLAMFGLGWLLLSCAPLAPLATTYGIDRRVLYAGGFGYALLIGGFLVLIFDWLQAWKKQWQLWPALTALVVVGWLIFSPLVQQNQQIQTGYAPYSAETLQWDLWILHNPAWVKQIPATQITYIREKLKQAGQIHS